MKASDPKRRPVLGRRRILGQLGEFPLEKRTNFLFHRKLMQPGWDIEWKRFSVYNAQRMLATLVDDLKRTNTEWDPANPSLDCDGRIQSQGIRRKAPSSRKARFSWRRPTEVSE